MTAPHNAPPVSLLPSLGTVLDRIKTQDADRDPSSLAHAREELGLLLKRFGIKGAFNDEAMPAFDMLESALTRMNDPFSRFVTLRFMARIAQSNEPLATRALEVLGICLKDTTDNNRHLLASCVRDIGLAHPNHTDTAARLIADVYETTTMPDSKQTLEVMLTALGRKHKMADGASANAATVATYTLGQRLMHETTAKQLRQPLDDLLGLAKDSPMLVHDVLQSISARLQKEMEQQENALKQAGRIDKERCLLVTRLLCRALDRAMGLDKIQKDDIDDGLRTLARGIRKSPDFDIAMCYSAALHRCAHLAPDLAVAEIEDGLYQADPARKDARRLFLVTLKSLAEKGDATVANKVGLALVGVADIETDGFNRKQIAEGLLACVVNGFDAKEALPALENMARQETRGSDVQEDIRSIIRRLDSNRSFTASSAPVIGGDNPIYGTPKRPRF